MDAKFRAAQSLGVVPRRTCNVDLGKNIRLEPGLKPRIGVAKRSYQCRTLATPAGDLSQLNSIRNTGLDLRRDPNTFQTNTLAGSPGMGSPGRAVVARHGVEVRQVNFMVKPNGRLVLVSFTHYCAFTPSLSNT